MSDHIGSKWLSNHTGIAPVQPFPVESMIGPGRRTVLAGLVREETYPPPIRPDETIPGHLSFSLKHESVHLEFLSRLFHHIEPSVLEDWIRSEPTGQYARRAGFLYEWLTGKTLDVPGVNVGNYIDALNPDDYLVDGTPIRNPRWRVWDNLLGSPELCPIVRRTDSIKAVEKYDCAKALHELEITFGADVLLRSAVWLTIRESKASFVIEHEGKKVDRIRRFADAMERRCGVDGDPLEVSALTSLQKDILGEATRYGMRQSPVFVGHNDGFVNAVDYIAPHWDDTASLMDGLKVVLNRTRGQSSVLRSAIASFGFVYIHPMADGNGRISRFLVNDVLRRDGAVPAPFILPISATITNSSQERAGYDRALEVLSKPLMARFKGAYKFGSNVVCADGIKTNFEFDAYAEALPAWRYPDLTHQSEYLGHIVQMTIENEMTKEALYLRNMDLARDAVKNWLEGPNTDIDRIIRSIQQQGWMISNSLRKEFPHFANEELARNVIDAVREVMDPRPLPNMTDEETEDVPPGPP